MLAAAGVAADVSAADLPEVPAPSESPEAYAIRVAAEKASAVGRTLGRTQRSTILAADTVVTLDGQILGKPGTADEAFEMLTALAGRTHEVLTAFAVRAPEGALTVGMDRTRVTFRALEADEIRTYVASGEPMDKAGAYGIQGRAGMFVAEIRGSQSGIVGLPLCETALLLRRFGYPI